MTELISRLHKNVKPYPWPATERILGPDEMRCVMQPQDVMFMEVFLASVGMIIFGAVIPSVAILLWFGLAIAIGISTWWIVNNIRRHGTQY